MTEDWLGRWDQGRIGWHEAAGNEGLKSHWPELPDGSSVLVPLCGKAPDLLWLAKRGHVVVGVELSDIAVAKKTLSSPSTSSSLIASRAGHLTDTQRKTIRSRCTAVTISVLSQQHLMPCTTAAPWLHYRKTSDCGMSSTPGNCSGPMLRAS